MAKQRDTWNMPSNWCRMHNHEWDLSGWVCCGPSTHPTFVCACGAEHSPGYWVAGTVSAVEPILETIKACDSCVWHPYPSLSPENATAGKETLE